MPRGVWKSVRCTTSSAVNLVPGDEPGHTRTATVAPAAAPVPGPAGTGCQAQGNVRAAALCEVGQSDEAVHASAAAAHHISKGSRRVILGRDAPAEVDRHHLDVVAQWFE